MEPRKVKRILVFSFSHIGDVVLSTAVIPPLQKHFPGARISFLVGQKPDEILRGDMRISELIVYDNRDRHAGLAGRLKLVKELRAGEFDCIVDLRDSFMARFIGGAHWGISLFQRFKNKELHAVERYLDVLHSHGVSVEGSAPKILLSDYEKQKAANFLSRNDITGGDVVIGIHPGGGWQYKLWPIERFSALGDLLHQKYGAKVIVFAGTDETELQRRMSEQMNPSPIFVYGVGLRELAAIIQQCRLYIGNDTGPMHIAAAVGVRVISIFGPTSAVRSGPYGSGHVVISEKIECSPCHPGSRPGGCKRGSCLAMEAVPLSQVADAVERILNEKSYISC